MENLINLRALSLTDNQITEIKGLETLTKLDLLYIMGNELLEDLNEKFAGNGKKYVRASI